MRCFLLSCFLLVACVLHAQMMGGKTNLDSLVKVAESGPDDTGKVNACINLVRAYRFKDTTLAAKYTQQAYRLAGKLNWAKGLAKAELAIANTLRQQQAYDSMFVYYDLSLQHANEAGDHRHIALLYCNVGQTYYDMGNTDLALRNFIMADSVSQKFEDKFTTLSVLNSISGIYFSQKEYKLARQYTQKLFDYAERSNDLPTKALAYNNLGNIAHAEEKQEDAIAYYLLAITTYGTEGSIQLPQTYANISDTYFNLKKYDSTMYYARKGIPLAQKFRMFEELARCNILTGAAFFESGQPDSALVYGELGLKAAMTGRAARVEGDAHKLLATVSEARKDFAKALYHERRYGSIQDSLTAVQDEQLRRQMLARFDLGQKEKDIQLLNEQRRFDKMIFSTAGVGAFIVLLLLFNRYKIKQKANKQLEAQNTEIRLQRDEISSKNKEITDSINYARRIQVGVLPDERLLRENATDNFILFLPRDIMSGDVYWFAQKEHRFYIAVADCTGHGVPGALVSVIGINLLNQVLSAPGLPDTGEVLIRLHRMVISALNKDVNSRETKDGMDIGLVCIDRQKGEAEFSGAGRPLFVAGKDGVQVVKGDRDSIGGERSFDDARSFTVHRLPLEDGKTFYLTSDGYVDQFGQASGKKFLTRRFRELLERIHTLSLAEQKQVIEQTFNEWKGELEQVDDVLVAGFKV